MAASSEISAFLQDRIAAGDFPSAVYLVAEKGEIVLHDAVGNAVVEPGVIPARADTVYDLASMTKVLVTGLLMAIEVEKGSVSMDDAVAKYLPEFDVPNKRSITIGQLLSHTSGLPAWRPFYLLVDAPSDVLGEIGRLPVGGDQQPVTYSDPNFLSLQAILERVSGRKIDRLFESEIAVPLGLESTAFNPLENILISRIAASERGNGYEKQMCEDLGYLTGLSADVVSRYFRDWVILGDVHDGNAYFMGGVAGHAGLFSTSEETLKIAQQFLPQHTKLLRPETCELFTRNLTPGLNEHRSFAFQLASTSESTAGPMMSPQSFGHLGFTGTSIWIDPVKDRIFILLTNRTHHHPPPFVLLNSVRRQFHGLAIAALDQKK